MQDFEQMSTVQCFVLCFRLMRNLANKEETIELKKRERNLKMVEQQRKRGEDFKSRLEAKQDKENTV